jgi:hypothetical protein
MSQGVHERAKVSFGEWVNDVVLAAEGQLYEADFLEIVVETVSFDIYGDAVGMLNLVDE